MIVQMKARRGQCLRRALKLARGGDHGAQHGDHKGAQHFVASGKNMINDQPFSPFRNCGENCRLSTFDVE
jgi:hypothetical protein